MQNTPMNDLSVVVPVRNAEDMIEDCLASIARSRPHQIIVVDGMSSDRTLEIARRFPVTILSDEGAGLPAARLIGAQAASTRHVALIDADVVLHDGSLERLLEEFLAGDYMALQAGLHSISGDGYWGRALAHHHRSGRSKRWFGLVATIFERDALLRYRFDDRFKSGEDIDLRWRLRAAGAKLGVSDKTIVEHRFGDTWKFAKGQWLADGHGLSRMVAAHGARAKLLLGLPLAASLRGIVHSLAHRQPQWIPYYLCYAAYNYVGMVQESRQRMFGRGAPAVASAAG